MSESPKNYKELKFWQTAFETTILVVGLVRKLPREKVFWIVGDQLIRAASSIGANIAEGFGRYKGKEFERFLQIALGSANEVEYWLLILKRILPRFDQEISEIIEKNNQTIRMLASSLKTLRKRRT
ncbi:four helix bundle protein [Candidatus Shapirobacteria bacterium CG10_big_fil_rev_8_21_14_0_10_40_9]|uniref:Four helix bundle protein n=1 Tax=Candidatus Shapirobacteria bacterium CG10_big_fil_rev_8_21_14_0_10_40_9 TaxID=1974888 RepID=A0A2M8L4D3_9BACT|nr:MAG: four helix bundle protein [Candidatus Shapirobacteria bacterium CG10_big_fil_rev_8_21_14_0_10_40_9]